jgi:putative ABC transport system permease protein
VTRDYFTTIGAGLKEGRVFTAEDRGASARQVERMFIRHRLGLTAAGLVVGGIASVLAGQAMRTMPYEVAPTDMKIHLAVAALLCMVASTACYIPARRAARVDPMVTLRDE